MIAFCSFSVGKWLISLVEIFSLKILFVKNLANALVLVQNSNQVLEKMSLGIFVIDRLANAIKSVSKFVKNQKNQKFTWI